MAGDLPMFVAALAVIYLLPGADMVLMLDAGARKGRAGAVPTLLGLAAARGIHVTLASLGLAALVQASPLAFNILRAVGAAYLIWLGWSVLRAPSLLPDHGAPSDQAGRDRRAAFLRGLLTNLLNPKALLFCSMFLPQFFRPGEGAGQFLVLGAILVAMGMAFDALYAGAGAGLGRWLGRHPLARSLQRWLFASALFGFGARLLWSGRP